MTLPRIVVIGTGGTISSLGASSLDVLDYPDFGQKLSCEALLDRFPEARLVADPVPVTLTYTVQAASAVIGAFLQLSSYAPSGRGVTWSLGFVATNRMISWGHSGLVTLSPPRGANFSAATGAYTCFDVTTFLAAGPAGLSLSSSGAPVPARASYALGPPTSVSGLVVQLSSWRGSATGVGYSVSFRVTNGLAGLPFYNYSQVSLQLPAGTVVPVGHDDNLYDDTEDVGLTSSSLPSALGSTVTFGVASGRAAAGDELTALVTGVTNPAKARPFPVIGISTGSDPRLAFSSNAAPAPLPAAPAPAPVRPSTIATSLPSPLRAFRPLTTDVVNGGIALGAALFITFPSNLFNQTFQDNYPEISAWWAKWAGIVLPAPLRRQAVGASPHRALTRAERPRSRTVDGHSETGGGCR